MIGNIARMAGLDLGKMVGGALNNVMGNSTAGNGLGSIAQGLTSFLTGDLMGMLSAGKNAFSSFTQPFQAGTGNANMFGGGNAINSTFPQLPTMPQVGTLGAGNPFAGNFGQLNLGGGAGAGLGGAANALGQMQSLRGQMEGLMSNKNMSPEDKQLATMKLQQEMQSVQQLLTMITTMMKKQHDLGMSIIQNLR